jgi:hypothetical protein
VGPGAFWYRRIMIRLARCSAAPVTSCRNLRSRHRSATISITVCAGWPRCSCGSWEISRPARPPCAMQRGSCLRSGLVAAPPGPEPASGLKVRVDDANYMISVPGAGFKPVEFNGIRKQAVPNSFTLTPKQWIERASVMTANGHRGCQRRRAAQVRARALIARLPPAPPRQPLAGPC